MNQQYQKFEKIQELSIAQLSEVCYDSSGKLITITPQKPNIFLENDKSRQLTRITSQNSENILLKYGRQIFKQIAKLIMSNPSKNNLNSSNNNHLPEPAKKLTVREKANLRLAYYWLTIYQPEPGASNLEKVKGYLQAFRHFGKMGEWEKASQILLIKVPPVDEDLGTQLRMWGYCEECIQLYSRLLGKLEQRWDGICLTGLGLAYDALGEYHKAIEHHQQSLQIAREIGDRSGEGRALGNLGNAYLSLGEYEREYDKAMDYDQQSLQIAREIGDRSVEGIVLGNLGNVYLSLGEYNKAMEYFQQSLQIAREIGDRSVEGNTLRNLGVAYKFPGKYDKAMDYYQQGLQIAREIGDRSGEGRALGNLGNVYNSLGEYHKAIEYHQQRLQIVREIGDRSGEGSALANWGETLLKLEKYAESLEYSQAALEIFQQIGNPHHQAIVLNNIAETHQHLGNVDAARQYCDEAIAIFTELGVPQLKECQELREEIQKSKFKIQK